jgi:hypothetical protein
MRPVLFDTNAYASFKRNDAAVIEVVRHAELIAIMDLFKLLILGRSNSAG